jgi:hypothetical protein
MYDNSKLPPDAIFGVKPVYNPNDPEGSWVGYCNGTACPTWDYNSLNWQMVNYQAPWQGQGAVGMDNLFCQEVPSHISGPLPPPNAECPYGNVTTTVFSSDSSGGSAYEKWYGKFNTGLPLQTQDVQPADYCIVQGPSNSSQTCPNPNPDPPNPNPSGPPTPIPFDDPCSYYPLNTTSATVNLTSNMVLAYIMFRNETQSLGFMNVPKSFTPAILSSISDAGLRFIEPYLKNLIGPGQNQPYIIPVLTGAATSVLASNAQLGISIVPLFLLGSSSAYLTNLIAPTIAPQYCPTNFVPFQK